MLNLYLVSFVEFEACTLNLSAPMQENCDVNKQAGVCVKLAFCARCVSQIYGMGSRMSAVFVLWICCVRLYFRESKRFRFCRGHFRNIRPAIQHLCATEDLRIKSHHALSSIDTTAGAPMEQLNSLWLKLQESGSFCTSRANSNEHNLHNHHVQRNCI